jgi:hypothetical protein
MPKPTAELWSGKPHTMKRYSGIIANDEAKRFPDGRLIYTSKVIRLKGNRLETMNTIYTLKGEWTREWSFRVSDMQVHNRTDPFEDHPL